MVYWLDMGSRGATNMVFFLDLCYIDRVIIENGLQRCLWLEIQPIFRQYPYFIPHFQSFHTHFTAHAQTVTHLYSIAQDSILFTLSSDHIFHHWVDKSRKGGVLTGHGQRALGGILTWQGQERLCIDLTWTGEEGSQKWWADEMVYGLNMDKRDGILTRCKHERWHSEWICAVEMVYWLDVGSRDAAKMGFCHFVWRCTIDGIIP